MERLFKLRESGTSVRTEILAGSTTFLTMMYIIIVNPAILSSAGVPFNQACKRQGQRSASYHLCLRGYFCNTDGLLSGTLITGGHV